MRPKKAIAAVIILVFTILQASALNYLKLVDVKPDILLLLTGFFGLYYGRKYGLILGFICGFMLEATSGVPTGFTVFSYALTGFILGYIGKWIRSQKAFGQALIAFGFCLFAYLVSFFLFAAFNQDLSLPNILIFKIIPASLYSSFAAPFVFRFLSLVLMLR